MFSLVSLATQAPDRKRYDDDSVDRLHNTTTVIILVVFAVVITGQHYYGSPITCWTPAHFSGGWTKYTNNLCWVNNTYFLPLHDSVYIPRAHEIQKHQYIEYYQWMPFILLAMAFFFYIPSQVWTAFNSKSGVDSDNILEAAHSLSRCTDPDKKKRTLTLLRNQIHFFVSNPRFGSKKSLLRKITNLLCCVCGLWSGSYLIALYIVVKILYVVNVILQLTALNFILKTDFSWFGFKWFLNEEEERLDEQRFLNNTVFPKVTMCDIQVRVVGNVQRHTFQCVLPVNLFTEKMFFFLYWWMLFILVCTVCSLFVWIVRTLINTDRLTYMRNHLDHRNKLSKYNHPDDDTLLRQFTYDYLRQDGVFLFRMIGHNNNQLTVDDIIASVWDNWREKQKLKDHDATLLKHDLFEPDMTSSPNGNKPGLPPKPGNLQRPPSVPSAPAYKKLDTVDSGSNDNFAI